jgi:hypothetical protein
MALSPLGRVISRQGLIDVPRGYVQQQLRRKAEVQQSLQRSHGQCVAVAKAAGRLLKKGASDAKNALYSFAAQQKTDRRKSLIRGLDEPLTVSAPR